MSLLSRRMPIARDGVRSAAVDATPATVLDLLADPPFVTAALDDLLDQARSSASDPVRWAIPTITVATATIEVVLAPTWRTEGERVVIDAASTTASDAEAELVLGCAARPGDAGTVLTIEFDLGLAVRLDDLDHLVGHPETIYIDDEAGHLDRFEIVRRDGIKEIVEVR